MAVTDFARSADHQIPAALFEFTYGEGVADVYRVTNHTSAITHDSEVFSPVPIKAEEVENQLRDPSVPLEISMIREAPLAPLFGIEPLRRVVLLRVFEGYIADGDAPVGWTTTFRLVWSGRVLTAEPDGPGMMKLSCDTLGAGMKRPMLRESYSRECQATLYGEFCNANKVAATYSVVVDSVAGRVLTVPDLWFDPEIPGNFLGGTVEWTGALGSEVRRIVAVTQTSITLDGAPTDLSGGDTVSVVLGCAKTFDFCSTVHGNAVNYRGCRNIPKDNPVGKNNHT